MNHLVEVTSNFFYSIIDSGDRNDRIESQHNLTDVIYIKHGVTMVYRSQNGIVQYYIQDINA